MSVPQVQDMQPVLATRCVSLAACEVVDWCVHNDIGKRMATTIAAIQKQIAQLQQQAEKIRQQERAATIARLRETIAAHDISADELFGTARPASRKAVAKKTKAAAKPNVGVPKYRDPKTGKTWTGTGKPPAWIAGARDRTKFLIEQPVIEASEETPAAPARKARPAVKKAKAVAAKKASAAKDAKGRRAAAAPKPSPAADGKRAVSRKAKAPQAMPAAPQAAAVSEPVTPAVETAAA